MQSTLPFLESLSMSALRLMYRGVRKMKYQEIPVTYVEESKMAAQSQKQEEHTRFHMPSEPHLLSEKLQQYK